MPRSAPSLLGVADAILDELRQVQDWITEIRADLVETERKRLKLACALDAAVAALEPEDRAGYEDRIKAVLGALGRMRIGRPHSDERFDSVMKLLADSTEDVITTTDIRLDFERRRFGGSRSYVSNLLKRLEKRGLVLRAGYGRYRIVRQHPDLVARRTGLWEHFRDHRQTRASIRRL